MTDNAFPYQGPDSILLAWEAGIWSPTPPPPAVHSPDYRQKITNIFKNLWPEARQPKLLSFGCGNAMIEADLFKDGFGVLATDYAAEAVALARGKGLQGQILDVLSPSEVTSRHDFLFADGLLGHVEVQPQGLERLAATLNAFAEDHAWIVIAYELAEGRNAVYSVTGHDASRFYRPPKGEAWRRLSPHMPGWQQHSIYYIRYVRPGRGERTREVIVLSR